MQFVIRYEVADGNTTIEDEVVCLATSREQASDYVLAMLEEQYGDDAVLLSLDISSEEPREDEQEQE